jgi:flagellar motility protein MotE (MotC chaperone)
MDTKKAAKIIEGYTDNIAREILFSMKKKKAAEIISELKPEAATRIMNLQ